MYVHIHVLVLLCLVVCLTLLASFFLPSHLSLKHVHSFHTLTLTHSQTFHHGFPSHPLCLAYDPVQTILAIGTKHGIVVLYPPHKLMCTCGPCLLLSFFLLHLFNMYIHGLVFGVFGGFITPAFSFVLS